MKKEKREERKEKNERKSFPNNRLFFLTLFVFLLTINLSAQIQSSQRQAASLYERGRLYMAEENWYAAVEAFLECLRLNPSHAEGTFALAECYYELAEFDEALVTVRRARLLARGNMKVANLEVFTLIALGQLDAASSLVNEVLRQEPYNREALFAAGELDIARNRPSEALTRYREAVRRYPDDRRLLISLALVTLSLGDTDAALAYINNALRQHSDDYRVYYFASYIFAQANRLPEAIRYAERAVFFKPQHEPSLSLTANLRYRNNQFEEAIRLCDLIIERNRQHSGAWYLKGLSLTRLRRYNEAITILSTAISVNPDDEFIRSILEDALLASTALEDPIRSRFALWHFEKARDFRARNMTEQSLFEYRRGLRLNPLDPARREYAEILRLQGYPARYLEELIFLQDQGMADRSINDAVETYSSLLSNALFRQWRVNPIELAQRHWKIAVFSLEGQSSFYHADAGAVAASVIKEILVHDRNITPVNLDVRQMSFAECFRQARNTGADYFMIVTVAENERDIGIKAELFTARTGTPAAVFQTFRTGTDRLRSASKGIIDQLSGAMPLRGRLLIRKSNQALINKGKADGVKTEAVFNVVKNGRMQISNEGIGLVYGQDELVGTLTVTNVDEEIAIGTLAVNGFFDRIEPGDEILLQDDSASSRLAPESAANPELRALLRTLR